MGSFCTPEQDGLLAAGRGRRVLQPGKQGPREVRSSHAGARDSTRAGRRGGARAGRRGARAPRRPPARRGRAARRADCRPAPARSVSRVASPRQRVIASSIGCRDVVAAQLASVGELARELVGPVGGQRGRADAGQGQALEQVAGGSVALGLGGHQRARPCGRVLRRCRRCSRFDCDARTRRPREQARRRRQPVPAPRDLFRTVGLDRDRRRYGLGLGPEPSGVRTASRSRSRSTFCAAPLELGLALLEHRQERRGDEDRRVRRRPRCRRRARTRSPSASRRRRAADSAIGSSVMNVVASDRRIVSHSEMFAIVRERCAPHQRDVLPDAVEDDDRVVDRVPEHGQHRGDGRRRHLPAVSA